MPATTIFTKLFGRQRVPVEKKMDAETATTATAMTPEETAATATVTVGTAECAGAKTTTTTTENNTTMPNGGGGGGGARFQFVGAKAKMFRDMIAQHKLKKLDTDQTELLFIMCMSALAIACSFGALTTSHWQCQGEENHWGLWNTCQKLTVLAPPNNNETVNNTTATMTTGSFLKKFFFLNI